MIVTLYDNGWFYIWGETESQKALLRVFGPLLSKQGCQVDISEDSGSMLNAVCLMIKETERDKKVSAQENQ